MPALLFDHADAPFEAPPEAGDTPPPPPPVSWPGPERRAPEPDPRRRRWLTPALAAAVVAGLLGGAWVRAPSWVLDDDPTPVASGAPAVTETAATTGAAAPETSATSRPCWPPCNLPWWRSTPRSPCRDGRASAARRPPLRLAPG